MKPNRRRNLHQVCRKNSLGDRLSTQGSVMIEAALTLPLFFLFIYAIFEFSHLLRTYSSARAALSRAAHTFQAVSATQNIFEDQLFQVAGNKFVEELKTFGISTEVATLGKVSLSPGDEQNVVLTGWPCRLLPVSGYDEPYIYKLVSRVKWEPLIVSIVGGSIKFEISTLAVFETGETGKRPAARSDTEVVVYLPDISPVETRTRWIEKSLLPETPNTDPFCYTN